MFLNPLFGEDFASSNIGHKPGISNKNQKDRLKMTKQYCKVNKSSETQINLS